MRADDSTRPADAPWVPAGTGHHSNFKCATCHRSKSTFGRKLRRVLGLRTYVCAECVAKDPR